MSEYKLKTGGVEKKVVDAYQKVEDTVVGGYKKIEDAVVGGYKKIEDAFVDAFLEKKENDEAASEADSEKTEKEEE